MFPIFDKLGGVDAALKAIERRRGRALSPFAVRGWVAARRIAPINVKPLMEECRERGIPFDPITDFVSDKPFVPRGPRQKQ